MSFERPLFSLLLAGFLLLLFLFAVREGRFASPGQRWAVVIAIFLIALLAWLLPFPAH